MTMIDGSLRRYQRISKRTTGVASSVPGSLDEISRKWIFSLNSGCDVVGTPVKGAARVLPGYSPWTSPDGMADMSDSYQLNPRNYLTRDHMGYRRFANGSPSDSS